MPGRVVHLSAAKTLLAFSDQPQWKCLLWLLSGIRLPSEIRLNVCTQLLYLVTTESLTVRNLTNELASVSEWYMLGIQLGVPPDQLDAIETLSPRVDRKRTEMLHVWLKNSPGASWQDVVKALKNIREVCLAERIEKQHPGGTPPFSPTSSTPSNIPSTEDRQMTESVEQIEVTKRNLAEIRGKFGALLVFVCAKLQEKLTGKEVEGKFWLFLLTTFDVAKQCIPHSSNLEEIFEAITHHIAFGTTRTTTLLRRSLFPVMVPHCPLIQSFLSESQMPRLCMPTDDIDPMMHLQIGSEWKHTMKDTGMVHGSSGIAHSGVGPQEEPVLQEQQCKGGPNHLHWCNMCSQEKEHPATAHCQTCQRYICGDCREVHRNVKDYKGHNVIPLKGHCSTLVVDIKPRIGRVDEQVSHHMQSGCEIICTQTLDGIYILVMEKEKLVKMFLREPFADLGLPVRTIESHGIDGLTVNADGHLVASEKWKGEVAIFERTGKKLQVIKLSNFPQYQSHNSSSKTSLYHPSGVAVDKEGCIYVADCKNHSLAKFFFDGSDFKIASVVCKYGSKTGELHSPGGLKVSENGEIFVCDCGNNRIQIFDSNLKFLRCFGEEGTSDYDLSWPVDLDFDSRGNVFVSDLDNHRIQVFDVKENFHKILGEKGSNPGQLNYPSFLFIDRCYDYLYVSDNGNQRISVFQTSGDFVQVLTCKTTWPKGITADRDGFLYVGQRDENILVFQALTKNV